METPRRPIAKSEREVMIAWRHFIEVMRRNDVFPTDVSEAMVLLDRVLFKWVYGK